jgi:hypothetical protein
MRCLLEVGVIGIDFMAWKNLLPIEAAAVETGKSLASWG